MKCAINIILYRVMRTVFTMDLLRLVGRKHALFTDDLKENEETISSIVAGSSFLVIGGAGSIGRAVSKEIFIRNPKKLHVVDISENNLVELVRDLRSSFGYIKGDFKTFAIDNGSLEFEVLLQNERPFDYILNLSALKHVRSEKDPYTLMRLIEVNVMNSIKTIDLGLKYGTKKYFSVSTDKAANPVNMMGASKKIMEMFLMEKGKLLPVSTARFPNVAFSDGSLLFGFNQRVKKEQPIAVPKEIKRYFITPKESGELCLFSAIIGKNREIFFPNMTKELRLTTFSSIIKDYLRSRGYELYICDTEEEARIKVHELIKKKKWPCFFSPSDTTGEKKFEEFFTISEEVDLNTYKTIGIVKNSVVYEIDKLEEFIKNINELKRSKRWTKKDIVHLFTSIIPNFNHKEKEKNLDEKM